MLRVSFSFALIVLSALAAHATTDITVSLPADIPVERHTVRYDCGTAGTLEVEYVNAGSVSLVIFAYEEEPVLAANVIAASGARYAGGRYVWWTRGPEAALYDVTDSEDAPPIAECVEAG